jgi:hypothetical protein
MISPESPPPVYQPVNPGMGENALKPSKKNPKKKKEKERGVDLERLDVEKYKKLCSN